MRQVELLQDPVTGLSSEWHFDIVFDFVFPNAHRGVHLTLVLFGIDEGSRAADPSDGTRQVAELGSALREATRSSDLVARHGEDLFICLLPHCNVQGGLIFADRIRDAISERTKKSGISVSAALVSHSGEEGATKDDMLRALRRGLQSAWAKGGDRVEMLRSGWWTEEGSKEPLRK